MPAVATRTRRGGLGSDQFHGMLPELTGLVSQANAQAAALMLGLVALDMAVLAQGLAASAVSTAAASQATVGSDQGSVAWWVPAVCTVAAHSAVLHTDLVPAWAMASGMGLVMALVQASATAWGIPIMGTVMVAMASGMVMVGTTSVMVTGMVGSVLGTASDSAWDMAMGMVLGTDTTGWGTAMVMGLATGITGITMEASD